MEKNNNLPVHRPQGSLILSGEVRSLAVELGRINHLVAYPVPVEDIISWAGEVNRLLPEVEPEALKFLFDQFYMEVLEWDKAKGIQNVFAGLKKIHKVDGEWKIKKVWPG